MTIEIINGDLLEALDKGEVQSIAHCVNTMGFMGAGIAAQIKKKYPNVFTQYSRVCNQELERSLLLGKAHKVVDNYQYPDVAVYNLFGQSDVGLSKRQVDYGAISLALFNMSQQIHEMDTVIGFPYGMCCGLAGGDWEIVLEMIEFYFKDHTVKIYKLV